MSNQTQNILKNIVSAIAILTLFILPLFVMAQDPPPVKPPPADATVKPPEPIKMTIEIKNPFKQGSIPEFLKTIIRDILMPIGGVIAVLMIMWAGFKYVTAGGDTKQIGEATEALKYAVIGAALLLGAWVISQAIQVTINQFRT